jgi:hypothetical protein
MAQTVTPAFLLQTPPGWSVVGKKVVSQITPAILPAVQLDGFEWFDVSGLGVGGTQAAAARAATQLRQQAQLLGSDLYAYTLLRKTEVNINVLGVQLVKVDRYRLVVCHSWAFLGAAALIVAAAVVAFIVFEFRTTGQSPTLDALQKTWAGLTSGFASGVGSAAAVGILPVLLVVGGAGILLAAVSKKAGVEPSPPPKGHVEVNTGLVTAGVRS